jgi:dCMP deaminase
MEASVKQFNQRPSRAAYFMLLAKLVSIRSTCNSRKTGAVIVVDNHVVATGYNGAVHGGHHCSDVGPDFCFRRDHRVPDRNKQQYCVGSHAEANAITQAARYGISISGSSIYCTLEPCRWCLKMIIQAGIKMIFFETAYGPTDTELEAAWRRQICSGGNPTMINIGPLSPSVVAAAIDVINGETSVRKMEPKDFQTGSTI